MHKAQVASKYRVIKDREEEWRSMVRHGLDPESASKVLVEGTSKGGSEIQFTSYAMIGLRNFYSEKPGKFMELLMQGPPIDYRWLAWRMVGTLLLPKAKGAYETYLRQGNAGGNKWGRVIDNDVNRTFPFHQFFKRTPD